MQLTIGKTISPPDGFIPRGVPANLALMLEHVPAVKRGYEEERERITARLAVLEDLLDEVEILEEARVRLERKRRKGLRVA